MRKSSSNSSGSRRSATPCRQRLKLREQDLLAPDVRAATVVTFYLLPAAMPRLEKNLLCALKPGTRVVVQDYPFPTWRADRVIELKAPDKETSVGTPFAQLFL